jgi:Flp pilus assembly protein TadG
MSRMRAQHGQAMLETALTLPLMVVLLLGFLAVLVRIEAQLELDAATSLAAAAAVNAPAGSPLSAAYARDTWNGTLGQYRYLRPGRLDGCGGYAPGQAVTCQGSATLDYGQTPMGLVVPFPVDLSSAATARSSLYRSR